MPLSSSANLPPALLPPRPFPPSSVRTPDERRLAPTLALPLSFDSRIARSTLSTTLSVCFEPLTIPMYTCLAFTLLDSSAQIVEAIWPLSSVIYRNELSGRGVLPLRTFIQETLRRSRTSYSTLQVALYYLVLIKPHVPKHNFTTEQPDDRDGDRSLQCGRRMFLAALILASKYLQDRNYTARAWSKISGLHTQEINQNEIAFLIAVNWKLHIVDDVFKRWTDIVLKYTPPPSPPAAGGASPALSQQVMNWKHIILGLNTDLTNLAEVVSTAPASPRSCDLPALAPRSILNQNLDSSDFSTTPKAFNIAPERTVEYAPSRFTIAQGMLPTPRPSPQTCGFSTPAASAASSLLGKSSAMSLAMAQPHSSTAPNLMDRFLSTSPSSYCPVRRSSLANSVSTSSSPDSMISDSSRSSSFSSASSLASATLSNKLGMPSRFRGLKLGNERLSQKPTIPSVPEDYDENCLTSSPESYTGPVGKLMDMNTETPLARREREIEELAHDAASNAARALQELQNYRASADVPVKTGTKRCRTASMDGSLQDNVSDLLNGQYNADCPAWPAAMVRSRPALPQANIRIPVRPTFAGSQKRMCCSAEAAQGYEISSARAGSRMRRPGMWEGILN